jgi:cell division protein FtsB
VSARAAAPSPAATQGERHERRPVRLTQRAALLAAAVFVVALLAIAPARSYFTQRDRVEDLERRAVELEAANRELQVRIADLNDPATLERLARECLGMVRPGEVPFRIIPAGEAPAPIDCD